MDNSNILFGITNLSSGILFILISLPLINEKIPKNPIYGFRIRKALSSDENWYKINAYGGRQLFKWSCLLVGIGILDFLFPNPKPYPPIECALYAVGPMLICIFVTIIKTILFSKTLVDPT